MRSSPQQSLLRRARRTWAKAASRPASIPAGILGRSAALGRRRSPGEAPSPRASHLPPAGPGDYAVEHCGTFGVGERQRRHKGHGPGQFVEPVVGFSATGSATLGVGLRFALVFERGRTHTRRLHKPGVAGSSPAAASGGFSRARGSRRSSRACLVGLHIAASANLGLFRSIPIHRPG